MSYIRTEFIRDSYITTSFNRPSSKKDRFTRAYEDKMNRHYLLCCYLTLLSDTEQVNSCSDSRAKLKHCTYSAISTSDLYISQQPKAVHQHLMTSNRECIFTVAVVTFRVIKSFLLFYLVFYEPKKPLGYVGTPQFPRQRYLVFYTWFDYVGTTHWNS